MSILTIDNNIMTFDGVQSTKERKRFTSNESCKLVHIPGSIYRLAGIPKEETETIIFLNKKVADTNYF